MRQLLAELQAWRRTRRRRSPPRVIVADDDDDIRALLCAVLRQDGYEVVEARDGDELTDRALDWVVDPRARPAALVIADICMPGASGLEVLAELAATHWAPPTVLITGHADHAQRTHALLLGALAVLDKPVDVAELRTLVHSLLPRPTSAS